MAISRAQMGSQLTGNKMKKTKKMKDGGKLLNMLSPAAALVNTIRSGEPQGLMNLSPLAHALSRGQRGDGATSMPEEAQATPASGMTPMARPALPARGMKKGGKVRGDGVCQRGKTKGRMT
jgi:hypothetical protein